MINVYSEGIDGCRGRVTEVWWGIRVEREKEKGNE